MKKILLSAMAIFGLASLLPTEADAQFTVWKDGYPAYSIEAGVADSVTFNYNSLYDTPGVTVVRAGDDLKSIVENAKAGDIIALSGGTYSITSTDEETGEEIITFAEVKKTITIRGVSPSDRPTIKGHFRINDGAGLTMSHLVLDGSENDFTDQCFNFKTADTTYAALNVRNVEIKGYVKGVYYANRASTIESITFDHCNIHDIMCDGGDLFDCRKSYIKNLTFRYCKIWNSVQSRDLIRYDDQSSIFGGEPAITVDHCTINNVCNTAANKRLLYVRYAGNIINWSNNLVSNTKAVFSNQSKTSQPTFTNNAYYNCPVNMFQKVEKATTVADENSYNGEDPQYADADNGDFSIGNENVSKLGVGAVK